MYKRQDYHREISQALAHHLKELLHLEKEKSILVVGLGNREITPDALGPQVIQNLKITRHIIKEYGKAGMGLSLIHILWNTQVTKQSSLWVSTGWVQLTAFLVCVAAWFFTGRDSIGTLWQVENKYTLLGGILGTFITVTVIRSMGKLGPAQATMLIVIAQLVVSYLIEMFGLFGVEKQPFEWKKLAGTAIVVAGIVLFKWE